MSIPVMHRDDHPHEFRGFVLDGRTGWDHIPGMLARELESFARGHQTDELSLDDRAAQRKLLVELAEELRYSTAWVDARLAWLERTATNGTAQ